ncbi:MAG TPA: peptidoglycan DD-metalloendopeptidase family protein, partial [Burkholderiaceae bacterium]|nr:peptidoglycan DD-metalloendopeptidase family protein [Burkholderiaceae bacterium]
VGWFTLHKPLAGAVLSALLASAAVFAQESPANATKSSTSQAPHDESKTSSPRSRAQSSANQAAATLAASSRRQRELQAEQRELKAKLTQLKKSLASAETAHSEAADALAASESAISASNRHLQHLASSRRQVEQRIAELQAREREAAAAQSSHASALGLALRSEFVIRHRSEQQDLVAPAQSELDGRDSAYLDSVVRARLHRIGELHDRRTELAELKSEYVQRSAELERILADERSSRAQLLQQEAVRRATLARLAHEIALQRRSVANLERDDARLSTLIDQIAKVLADQARRRAAAARSKAPAEARAASPEQQASSRREADHFEPPPTSHFARLRGKLLLPVQGQIASRYGAPRLGEDGQPQVGAPAWKGLFIRAETGSPVHAVAAGRVVFADWLRGFGNLLILDHGEGFLSVYADNEALLHGVGDAVDADEVIASVGNTGGSAQSGLYFEMRFQGRPFDPLAWAVAR